jgi:ribosomal protein S18 acetylase RimI-like enzyme
MNTTRGTSVVDIQRYDAKSVSSVIPEISRLYEVVYREPPYCEGPEDVAEFLDGLPGRAAQPAFRLVLATTDGKPVGFAFGHQLTADTKWWQGAITALPDSIVREHAGRTFAIVELAVAVECRRRGIARALHDALLVDANEQRATLLVRPEAMPARAAYERWGYVRVGAIRPWPEAPLYDAMVLNLRAQDKSRA